MTARDSQTYYLKAVADSRLDKDLKFMRKDIEAYFDISISNIHIHLWNSSFHFEQD